MSVVFHPIVLVKMTSGPPSPQLPRPALPREHSARAGPLLPAAALPSRPSLRREHRPAPPGRPGISVLPARLARVSSAASCRRRPGSGSGSGAGASGRAALARGDRLGHGAGLVHGRVRRRPEAAPPRRAQPPGRPGAAAPAWGSLLEGRQGQSPPIGSPVLPARPNLQRVGTAAGTGPGGGERCCSCSVGGPDGRRRPGHSAHAQ